jgi:hypothetical protein
MIMNLLPESTLQAEHVRELSAGEAQNMDMVSWEFANQFQSVLFRDPFRWLFLPSFYDSYIEFKLCFCYELPIEIF